MWAHSQNTFKRNSHLTLSAVFEMIVEKNTVMIKAAHVGNLKFQEFHNFWENNLWALTLLAEC